jgi:hypothetical protein
MTRYRRLKFKSIPFLQALLTLIYLRLKSASRRFRVISIIFIHLSLKSNSKKSHVSSIILIYLSLKSKSMPFLQILSFPSISAESLSSLLYCKLSHSNLLQTKVCASAISYQSIYNLKKCPYCCSI